MKRVPSQTLCIQCNLLLCRKAEGAAPMLHAAAAASAVELVGGQCYCCVYGTYATAPATATTTTAINSVTRRRRRSQAPATAASSVSFFYCAQTAPFRKTGASLTEECAHFGFGLTQIIFPWEPPPSHPACGTQPAFHRSVHSPASDGSDPMICPSPIKRIPALPQREAFLQSQTSHECTLYMHVSRVSMYCVTRHLNSYTLSPFFLRGIGSSAPKAERFCESGTENNGAFYASALAPINALMLTMLSQADACSCFSLVSIIWAGANLPGAWLTPNSLTTCQR